MSQALRNSSSNTSGAQQGNAPASAIKKDPLETLMGNLMPQMSKVLPKHITADRMARIITTELRLNEKLLAAVASNPGSFMGAMLRASTLGLEPANGLGHCYLVPFDKRRKQGNEWVTVSTEIQLIIGYKGMIDLARRSGQIENIYAVEVYGGEEFSVTLGLDPDIKHIRNLEADVSANNVIAVYAVAKLKGGAVQFEVMGRSHIESIRSRSKSKDDGPWKTDWAEMAKKTVVRRLFKYLPVSIDVRTANGGAGVESLSSLADESGFVIDGNTGEVLMTPNDQSTAPMGAENSTQQQHQQPPPPQQSQQSQQQSQPETHSVNHLQKTIDALNSANSVSELDEILIRAEGDLEGMELEQANRAYRLAKANLSDPADALFK